MTAHPADSLLSGHLWLTPELHRLFDDAGRVRGWLHVREPFVPRQIGSITMPHKRNPERSEHLDTLARVVRADAALMLEAMVHLRERDGRAWKTEWVIIPEACLATGAAIGIAARLLEGLEVNTERMRVNLEARRGYVLSEQLMRVLADRIGKHAAHEAVYRAAMAGLDEGKDFLEALLGDAEIVTHLARAEIERALDPMRALGAASTFVDRVLDG